jgi:putative membrane-bound dehydrogenase-like protein
MIQKPVQMNWDAQGRLWVVTSSTYPHIKPGEAAKDQVVVLEDTDGDGKADKSTTFADGLHIPTALAPGDGGLYVANSTEVLFLKDTDGDLKADERTILLSGFGTEDTHHLLHTFRWGPEGMLYFLQSIYIHTHMETPYGIRRLMGGGIWEFRPETRRAEIMSKGLINPWGFEFDRWGQSFACDGAGGEGVNFHFPGSVFATSPGAKRILHGLSPGQPKQCGLEIIEDPHFPADWQGSLC